MCRFESILCESIGICVCGPGLHDNFVSVCVHYHTWLSVCAHLCLCVPVQQMNAGRGVLLLAPLIGSIQTETWPSQQMSVRLPKTCTHTQTHTRQSTLLSPYYVALALSVFQPTVYVSSPCLHLCVFLCDHERFSLSSTWSVRIIWRSIVDTVHTFHKSLLISLKGKMQHGGMCASLYFIDSWRGLRALWKSLHLLCGDKANCNRPKHEAFMKMVFQLTSLLAVAEHSQSCIQASGAQCVTFL